MGTKWAGKNKKKNTIAPCERCEMSIAHTTGKHIDMPPRYTTQKHIIFIRERYRHKSNKIKQKIWLYATASKIKVKPT